MRIEDEQKDFVERLRRNEAVIYKICMMFTDRQPENVRDLYQEIVCNLWRNRKRFKGDCSDRSWFYRVGLNTAVSQFRKRRRRPLLVELSPEIEQSLEDEAKDERIDELYAMIGSLNDADKALIMLYIDGVPYAEIAQIAGISYASATKRISRIKEKLKNQQQK